MSGLFISLEGLDGCGKSTQASMLTDWLRENGRDVLNIREPGGCKISEQIREVLLNKSNMEMNPKTELLLYFAARAQLIKEILEPALSEGRIVVADRFGWATFAYQGYGRQMDLKQISILKEIACESIWPQHSFLLDISIDVMKSRLSSHKKLDRMERSGDSFFSRTREGYLRIAEENAGRFTVLNGNDKIQAIFNKITSKVSTILKDSHRVNL